MMRSLANANEKPRKEFELLRTLKGRPHIVEAYNFNDKDGKITLPNRSLAFEPTCLAMELCRHGDMCDFVINHGAIKDELLLKHLMVQVCSGIKDVHTIAEHAHLDVKLENILIGEDYLLKIIDFGFATPTSEYISKFQ